MNGHCLCGAVTVEVASHRGFTAVCHCRMCQRWSGGLFVCVPVEAEGMAVAGPVVRFASSGFAERAFCGVCGSHLWYRAEGGDGHYAMMPGLFDEGRDWPVQSEIYVDRALPGLALAGDHPRATRAAYEAKNHHIDGDMP